ncbi:hypothetical protein [Silvibacterium dinghuense]|uniref:Lipoprotein n=1 Tax=Silvibacterium dinghuense TaxID=1560006 RepID=A0A4Q1S9Z0_9BACT|nr:hypothetical protein [Silvibacterium dinghuense]RXS93745.1 hypothetical protein ESZ00_16995 [Silvibacterium dinghuense]GGH07306.1 hypothetical protein GCM10011586_24470 [Silvibacterium dinghuense]
MSWKRALCLTACSLLFLGAGCRKTNLVDKTAFESAINHSYSSFPRCVWSSSVKLPAQADTSNDEQTRGFDALTDAGLLQRSSQEKKRFLIGSKQVNNYDLTEKGRSVWTADPSQPGYGNFCYGHLAVKSIDAYTPSDNPDATQYTVNYHSDVTGLADWAKSTEMSTAFPKIATDTSGQQTATATLTKGSDGWQVSNMNPPAASAPANNLSQ